VALKQKEVGKKLTIGDHTKGYFFERSRGLKS